MNNKELLKAAKEAVQELFSDTSVSQTQCRENLEEIKADIDGYLDTLEEE